MLHTQEPGLLRPRIAEFLTFCGARNLSHHTIRGYRADLAEFAALAGPEATLAQINRKLLRAFIVKLHDAGRVRASVLRKLAAVKSLCKWLEGEGLLEPSLIDSVSAPRRRLELPDVPSEADLKRLLDGDIPGPCPQRDRVILELLYGSGLRASELVGINMSDFQEQDVLRVRGKGKKERLVIVGEYALRAVGAWLPVRKKLLTKFKFKTDALFFSVGKHRSVERLDVRSIGRIVKGIAKAKGLPAYHPHLLRHACGTHMHDHNAPLQFVGTFLGHARLSTAQIYTRVSVGRMMQTYRAAHPHAQMKVTSGNAAQEN